MTMFSLPNIISLTRIPLTVIFILFPSFRMSSIVLAMISDVLDGFLARRLKQASSLGATLDPLTDKLFVGAALITLVLEKNLTLVECIYFLSRDIALIFFVLTRFFYSGWRTFKVQAFYCGKIATSLQLCTLILLSLCIDVPKFLFYLMGTVGILSYAELMVYRKPQPQNR